MSDAHESLWIFGYGSLVWRPAFAHRRRRPAFIEGFARRFWQGSTDHRGVPGAPGRVVTLLPDDHASLRLEPGFRPERCWGTAYEVPAHDPDGVLPHLDHRERGGYERIELELSLQGEAARPSTASDRRPAELRVRGLVYMARPENENYLGPAPIEAIARQVASARGPSGENPEYVFELERSLRSIGAHDSHVFGVAAALRALVEEPSREADS
jgi:cation transport regulator ChaC